MPCTAHRRCPVSCPGYHAQRPQAPRKRSGLAPPTPECTARLQRAASVLGAATGAELVVAIARAGGAPLSEAAYRGALGGKARISEAALRAVEAVARKIS